MVKKTNYKEKVFKTIDIICLFVLPAIPMFVVAFIIFFVGMVTCFMCESSNTDEVGVLRVVYILSVILLTYFYSKKHFSDRRVLYGYTIVAVFMSLPLWTIYFMANVF